MKIKTLFLLVGITVSHLFSYAQKKEFKFGKIAPEEFQTKATGKDSAAAAIKLFDIGNCYFEYSENTGFKYVYQRHIRYKVLTKAGYDLANYKIGLYKSSGSSKEDLNGMEAATYNMVDGKMVISKITKDAKFTEEFNKNYTYKKFTLPNVKEGSILEFKYTIKSDFIFTLRGWSFQSDIPTLYSEYNVKIPEYFMYKTNFGGYIQVNRTKHETINATYVPSISSTATHDQYVLENVPALKDEAFITTIDDYIPSIEFELQGTRFPNEMYKDFNGTWPKIVKELADDENFGLFINKNSYAKSVLPTILKGEKDTLAMTKLIYDYVKSNIKWNEERGRYASGTNPKLVFEKKAGSSADINLCLVSLLREAQIDAHPLLVSTRDNGIHPGYPMISKFNNVLAHVVIANKNVLLDATDKDMQFGMIAFDNLNHEGLSIDLKSIQSAWIATEPTFASEKIFNYSLALDKENKLTGTITQYTKGYAALKLRDKYRTTNNETEFLKDFKKDKTGLELTNYKMGNLDNLDELLTETMNVVIEDNVEEAGNLVYFTPLLFEKTKENPFKHEERLFPVDFAYPIKENYRITVSFPEDYEVEKLPKSNLYKIPDNSGTFSITFFSQGKTLMVKSVIDINKTFYTPEEYFNLKELFKAIVEKQAEQIVFKKKA
ncbi:DUF3857 domain-containing protein [Pedobacter polaris]|uniref:DUF3857 domain-containing protein n=1 Tax=Pedobacter polaris TaxID=2571273 RepID=A0A4U1CX18_9SPHI|nr:DUF3858 domain-containing protein [Pedobacter polaris]TKC10588.1 DUF3857 domain-containing protein [Pedobacter polaris]